MFEGYEIELITETINKVVNISEDGVLEYESTHENRGIIELSVPDPEKGGEVIGGRRFEEPVNEEQAFEVIKTIIYNQRHQEE